MIGIKVSYIYCFCRFLKNTKLYFIIITLEKDYKTVSLALSLKFKRLIDLQTIS